jgi:ADP-ribose pyrophosphatase
MEQNYFSRKQIIMYNYSIENRKILHNGFLKLETASIKVYDQKKQLKSRAVRERTIRPNSAAVLLYNMDRDAFVLTRQFRYPVSDGAPKFVTELPAGGIDPDETSREAAIREVREEVGYKCTALKEIGIVYSSPGTCSEKIFIFYAEVSEESQFFEGGGVESENEIIDILHLDRRQLVSNLAEIQDAKTLIAVQWFLQNVNDSL